MNNENRIYSQFQANNVVIEWENQIKMNWK